VTRMSIPDFMFDEYLAQWQLTPDGEPIVTRGARLLPVRRGGRAAMLKVAIEAEEKFGGVLMTWWDGRGAARVLAADGDAILLERAQGRRSLSEFARTGRDDEATRIICDVIAALHAPRRNPLPDLIPLPIWFRELEPAAAAHGGILVRCAEAARALLADQRDVGPLHGDIHHDNILDFGERGWLAIDPKRLRGDRGFDYANLFCNPDVERPRPQIAVLPDRFAKRLEIVVERSGIERRRLLQWIVAWSGLSAAWFLGVGQSPETDFRIAELAIRALDG
jgi:streptomycin 6-kinase